MPMGEVYSALAKGVLDGVVAPADTFSSLHFTEVAGFFTDLAVPRGAYPARAMSEQRWNALSASHRRVLEEGVSVWEAALARETLTAVERGLEFAAQEGIVMHSVTPSEQREFDALYLGHAQRNAEALSRFQIDGRSVLQVARASVGPNGEVSCGGGE